VSGQLQAPAALSWGNSHRYPLRKRLGELQNWTERCGEDRNPVIAPGGN